jgi:hypothetical protein
VDLRQAARLPIRPTKRTARSASWPPPLHPDHRFALLEHGIADLLGQLRFQAVAADDFPMTVTGKVPKYVMREAMFGSLGEQAST